MVIIRTGTTVPIAIFVPPPRLVFETEAAGVFKTVGKDVSELLLPVNVTAAELVGEGVSVFVRIGALDPSTGESNCVEIVVLLL